MSYYNYPYAFGQSEDPTKIIVPPDPASYLELAKAQLARGCVVIQNITPYPNTQPSVVGHNPITLGERVLCLNQGRDIPETSDDFWTVRIVMISDEDDDNGIYYKHKNTIFINYETFCYNYAVSDPGIHIAMQRTLLHEIGHALIDKNHQPDGVMATNLQPSEQLLSQYHVFLPDDLKKIQEYSRVRDNNTQ